MTDDTAMKALVIEAMYKSLDDQKREHLIKNAITALLEEKPSGHGVYGARTSSLRDAFNDAIQQVAREVVFEQVRAPGPIRERIEKLCGDALGKLVLADDSLLATEFATALVRSLREARE